ncbi:MAG: cysteine desulfurase [Paludibacteraceae bacterium]|nr:cysteine desulfurase [Paludibacteraceae bacterium]
MNRADFPILKETVHGRPLVYLDNAATSQKPQVVMDAITEAYTHWNSNIHRGVHHLSQVATMKHEEARQAVADFIGAKSSDEIVFTKGTTDSLNALAFSFGEAFIREGDEIIVSAVEHHSNIVPWQMLCERKKAVLRHIPLHEDLTLDIEAFKGLLSEKTKLISVAHVSNVLGTINPVEEIIRIAHERNIPVCIDGAQSVPHRAIDVQALDCDFLAFSGHKMYGPTGIGVLYGKREWLELLPPHEGGGEMINHVRWSGTTYNELPYKFEAGTPNFVGSYALHQAINYMQSIGMDAIEAHERDLTEYCEERMKEENERMKEEGVQVHVYAASQPKAGVISFNVFSRQDLIHPFDIGTLLDQQGIAVRTGHHCAEPLIDELGVPGTVRVSFGLYNDRADIDAFIAALEKTIRILC